MTSFAGVPYTFDLLESSGFADRYLPDLRYVTQAGGRMAPAQVGRFAALGAARGWELFVMYGQTEATARMAYLPPDLAASRPEAVGIPVPGGRFRLAPVEGTALERGRRRAGLRRPERDDGVRRERRRPGPRGRADRAAHR